MTLTVSPAGLELIFSGALLFLIGLFQGVIIPKFTNSRMALSAHLSAVQSGMALMIFGTIWSLVDLPNAWDTLVKLALILSVYLIWLGITVAAVTGASKALPIAGEGYTSSKVSEHFVTAIEAVGVLLSLVSSAGIVVGLVLAF